MITARWYACNRSVYAYQNGGSDRLYNDPHICACGSKQVAELIADDHNHALVAARVGLWDHPATRIVTRSRVTT